MRVALILSNSMSILDSSSHQRVHMIDQLYSIIGLCTSYFHILDGKHDKQDACKELHF